MFDVVTAHGESNGFEEWDDGLQRARTESSDGTSTNLRGA